MKKLFLFHLLLMVSFTACTFNKAEKVTKEPMQVDNFDFWLGSWEVDTYGYGGFHEESIWKSLGKLHLNVFSVLDGKAVIEFASGQLNDGTPQEGFSIRFFDEEKSKWIAWLNWPDKNSTRFYSMEGGFFNNQAEFFTHFPRKDQDSLLIKFTFGNISSDFVRWESSASDNGGRSWYPDGMFFLKRSKEFSNRNTVDDYLHDHWGKSDSPLCDTEEFREMDKYTGKWNGKMISESGEEFGASSHIYSILNGCGIFEINKYTQQGKYYEELSISSYSPSKQKWLSLKITNQPGLSIKLFEGSSTEEAFVLSNSNDKITYNLYKNNNLIISKSSSKKTIHSLILKKNIRYE